MNTFSIQQLINNKLTTERKEKEITSWHASGLGSCLTGRYLERLGVKPDKEFDERTLRVFSVGRLMEEWVVNLLKETGANIETQARIEDKEYNLSGYADMIIEKNDKRLVYEIKSKHSKSFWYMEKQGGPQEEHKMQLWTYLWKLGIDEGRLIYLSKDDLSILEYPIYRKTKKLKNKVLSELELLNKCWEVKLPLEPIRDKNHWHFKYCRWHNQCLNQKEYYQEYYQE